MEASGNSIRKTGGCSGCPDAAATAEQQIHGDGGVQFATSDTSTLRFVGLSSGGASAPNEIEFAFRLQGGVAEVRESGAYKSEIRIASGDVLAISIAGGAVSYHKNGSAFFTSGAAPAYPMAVGAILFDTNGSVTNAVIKGGS